MRNYGSLKCLFLLVGDFVVLKAIDMLLFSTRIARFVVSNLMTLLTILFLLFLTLKLTGNIDWSWWWVVSPLIGSVMLVFFSFYMFLRKLITEGSEIKLREKG